MSALEEAGERPEQQACVDGGRLQIDGSGWTAGRLQPSMSMIAQLDFGHFTLR